MMVSFGKKKGMKQKNPKEKQKVYKKVIEHYTKALEYDLQQSAIYNNRGNAYGAIDEVDKSINDLSKAIELKPRITLMLITIGVTLIEKKVSLIKLSRILIKR